ncbi:hypothetical protein SAMN05920897_11790, partial [Alkalispirochaeta americana]
GSDEIQQAVTAVEQMSGKNGEGIARVKGIVDRFIVE